MNIWFNTFNSQIDGVQCYFFYGIDVATILEVSNGIDVASILEVEVS